MPGYQPKVYRDQSGNRQVVADGGSLVFEAGGLLTLPPTLRKGFIPLPLASWRLIGSNDIPVIAVASGNGGQLASDTAPKLQRVNAATDKKLRISWAAAGVVEITADFVYPPDLDDTADVVVNLLAGMAGAADTPVIAVGYFEGVGDTNAGGNTAALSQSIAAAKTVTIAAADVGAYPNAASVTLIPAAHGTDALFLYAAWVEFTRKTS